MTRRPCAPALALVLAAACGEVGTGEQTGLAEDRFVEVMVELRRAARADSAGFPARRDRILAEHDVTAADLRAFVRARGDDLGELRETWEEIDQRLTRPDSATPP